ncbi:MAG: tRNA pseudouridine(38-40) synthase TruA [Granulosicoccaceae bacterium]
MRIAAIIEYRGTHYSGWQFQDHTNSVQDELEKALGFVAAEPIRVVCAGRTDAGVHAIGQVVHWDTEVERPDHGWRMGANNKLPDDIAIQWVGRVADDFHARYHAIERSYRYYILNRASRSATAAGLVTLERRPLDDQAMHRAAQALVGEHDFSSFRASGCQAKHPVRTIKAISVRRQGEVLCVEVLGNAFLHNMIRIIVGNLIAVGCGDEAEGFVAQLLAKQDRRAGRTTAKPGGLYFVGPKYPAEAGVPTPSESAFFLPVGL